MRHSFPEFARAFYGLEKNSEGEHAMNIPRIISVIGAILSPHRNHQPLWRKRTKQVSPFFARTFLPVLVTVLLTGFWLSPAVYAGGSGSGGSAPGFGCEVIVDYQRITGEPSLSIDSQDRIYVSAPFGFSTTASYVWRSTDDGKTFHLVPGNLSPYGKPI
jgi:hypothetical protein